MKIIAWNMDVIFMIKQKKIVIRNFSYRNYIVEDEEKKNRLDTFVNS